MLKLDWGIKRVCQHCSARFYDLRKTPIICPKCAHSFDPDALLKNKRSRAAVPVPKEIPEVPLFDALVEEMSFAVEGDDVEDSDDVLIEDTSDLGGDDDVKEVIHRTEEENI